MDIKIEIKETTNDKILKFEASVFLTKHQSFEYNNIDEAGNSPLAQQLFYLPFIKKVYISANFVALERYDIVSWSDVKTEVAEQIENYLNSGASVIKETEQKEKVPVTVYAESTPNPTAMKFVANKKLVLQSVEFANIDEAQSSNLAKELFHFPFVKSVYLDENFVSVTKYDVADWNDITMELREFIRNFIESGKEVINNSHYQKQQQNSVASEEKKFEDYDEISQEIIQILDEYIKPAVASDGGNIVFQSYEEDTKTVNVILQGACSGCPSSTMTLKNGIETMLKEMIGPRIGNVVALNG
ncbi:Fe-S cluster biogenesis protein NfuA, 4Fe-4S-binding domain [Flavobacteriaceae bacterium MAR_2010_188]|nr:Fe-S cluster biogenesis protein NfuA, 4Fe-4S-binding domain [Flavobacteriaceae bacterium MAR_2010_188]